MRDFWNSQFKFSEVLPDFAASLNKMAVDSAKVSENEVFHHADYGSDPRQWVEWIDGEGSVDLVPVVLHGGYWRSLEAETHRFMLPDFKRHGLAVANVEYRLMPRVRLADVVADVKAALRLLGAKFPNAKLLLVGHSAGAHLALSALRDPEIKKLVRGVVSISGVFDLAAVSCSFLQDELKLTQEEIQDFTLRPEYDRPPVVYVNGSAETHEFLRSGCLMARSGQAHWHVIRDKDHMSLTWAVCAESTNLLTTLFELEHRNEP